MADETDHTGESATRSAAQEQNLLDMSEGTTVQLPPPSTKDETPEASTDASPTMVTLPPPMKKEPDNAAASSLSSSPENDPPTSSSSESQSSTTSPEQERIHALEQEIAQLKALQHHTTNTDNNDNNNDMLAVLQEKLQSEMAQKAEAEHQLKQAKQLIQDLQTQGQAQTDEFEKYKGLETGLQEAVNAKEDAEHDLQMALERIQTLEQERTAAHEKVEQLTRQHTQSRDILAAQEQELEKIREQRDEQERKEMSLTNRLNAAKKKEADKVNAAEKLKDELTTATTELQELRTQVETLTQSQSRLQTELEETIRSSRQRQVEVETALADEKRLNDDRKLKMKTFIEKKSEELRQAKTDNDALQVELNQTTRSLSDLNVRWKQLHAQWVQSQTRNRELQRDILRIKKDSEKQHKVGDTLEMKLSSSAKETEEHKTKRLAAKHELMTVLKTLESEREIAARLRDSIKFTFTPKALSQQQLLNESVQDFETQLEKLSYRLRKPLPPPSKEEMEGTSNNGEGDDTTNNEDDDWVETMEEETDTHRLIEKLNRETQHVSKCIMAVVSAIERFHVLLESDSNRTCYSVLNDILAAGGVVEGHHEERAAMTGDAGEEQQQFHSITNRDYR